MNAKTIIRNHIQNEYDQAVSIYLALLSNLFDRITTQNFYLKEFNVLVGSRPFSNAYEFQIENRNGAGVLDFENLFGFSDFKMLSISDNPNETDLNEILLNIQMLKNFYKFLQIISKMTFFEAATTFKNQSFKEYQKQKEAPKTSPKLNFQDS